MTSQKMMTSKMEGEAPSKMEENRMDKDDNAVDEATETRREGHSEVGACGVLP